MVVYYKHNEIDQEKWDQCIESSANKVIFSKYHFLSVASPNWGALIEGNYEIVMPLPCKNKFGIHYIYTPYFYSRLGIFSAQHITDEIVERFLEAIPKNFRQIDVAFHQDCEVKHPTTRQRVSYQLSLNKPYDALFQQFSNNHKRNIKTARTYQLSIDKNIPVETIISLFKNNRGKDKMIKIKDIDYGFFLQLTNLAQEQDTIDVWGVRDANYTLIAGGCFLRDGERIWFWFSGRDEQHFEKRAMFFLIDEYIQTHAEQPLTLDFNGSMNPNVARFYSGFGAEQYNYPIISYTPNSILKPLIQLYHKINH